MNRFFLILSLAITATTLVEGFYLNVPKNAPGLFPVSSGRQRTAQVLLVPGSDPNVSGNLILKTGLDNKGVLITGSIQGLRPGAHGFHVHMTGQLGGQCKDAGSHFNPAGHPHAGPVDSIRHAGDLGNIFTTANGHTQVNVHDAHITLGDGGRFDVAGRAVVVHAGEDDLGKGGNDESLKTGNAGTRLACGIIHLTN